MKTLRSSVGRSFISLVSSASSSSDFISRSFRRRLPSAATFTTTDGMGGLASDEFFSGICVAKRRGLVGEITMKMISSTSRTSINGVTLMRGCGLFRIFLLHCTTKFSEKSGKPACRLRRTNKVPADATESELGSVSFRRARFGQHCRSHSQRVGVNRSIAGDNAAEVANLGRVVMQWRARRVSHQPARLAQDRFRRTGVPLIGLRAEVNVEVCAAFGEQPDLQADAARTDLPGDAEPLVDQVNLGRVM